MMAAASDSVNPELRDNDTFHVDKYGAKLVDATEKLQDKAQHNSGKDKEAEEKKGPAGGFDSTPIPKAPPGYTIRITFHSADNLPFADLSLTSDPYIIAVLKTDLQKRHKQDPDPTLRTPTVHRNTNPVWNASWTIANVPASGFHLKARLYDEDPTDHDDRLGNVHVDVDSISDNWSGFKERKFTVKKRMGSKRAYTLRGCAALVSRSVSMSGHVTISVENLGKTKSDNGGHIYTVEPLPWSQHYSPLIGRLTGIKDGDDEKDGQKGTSKYNFQAIQMQLKGPVPEPLYHRYVEFRPFVAGMFTSHTLKGRILNRALHHQHARIYNYDTSTKYGSFEEPCPDMTKKFLDFVHYDQGGRIFTYVLTLDGQIRFTETGKEFGIDLLSKHTMHSDVSSYIAFSGEFFIRRLKNPNRKRESSPDPVTEAEPPAREPEGEKEVNDEQDSKPQSSSSKDVPAQAPPKPSHGRLESHSSNLSVPNADRPAEARRRSFGFLRGRSPSQAPSASNTPGPHENPTKPNEDPSKDPYHYELIIDNDSGTYRPNAKYLPQLKKFLVANFPNLKVVTLDCQKDEEKMSKLKNEQRERKKKSGKQITYMQNSSMSSLSSSDEEELERRAGAGSNKGAKGTLKKEWQKVKNFGQGSDDEKEVDHTDGKDEPREIGTAVHGQGLGSEKPGLLASETKHAPDHVERNGIAGSTDPYTSDKDKKASVSTDADHASFNTAFTDGVQADHFVTPKPSLGDGGLKQFDNTENETTPTANKTMMGGAMHGTVHDAVTSAS